MIRTTLSIETVPTTWIFEYYCKLKHRLHGQDIKIKSIFNESDTQPSMAIFYSPDKNGYIFKDFSSGKGGNGVSLVASMFNMPYNKAISKIIDDYSNRDIGNYEELAIKEESKFKVTSHTQRKWNELDAQFWIPFGIGSKLLAKYNVKPLAAYNMSKDSEEGPIDVMIKGQNVYGYFKDNGELYKLYQPKRVEYKFLNVLPYIQGSEQLTYSKSTLIIASSLKDIMSLRALDLDVETVAPQSENTMLSKSILSSYAVKYKRILTLFDNDKPGHEAMAKYQSKFGIPGLHLNLSKDISDSIRDHGHALTKKVLTQLLPKI